MTKTIDILKEKLCGNFISRFSVGDTWELFFDGCHLSSHDLTSKDEEEFNKWMANNYESSKSSVDKEVISKSAIVATHLRKLVTNIRLGESSQLTIEFENDTELTIPTNVSVVDWQWCLTEKGNDPYRSEGYFVACFRAGELKIG